MGFGLMGFGLTRHEASSRICGRGSLGPRSGCSRLQARMWLTCSGLHHTQSASGVEPLPSLSDPPPVRRLSAGILVSASRMMR